MVRRYFKDWAPRLIFDVGANIGQMSVSYATAYPEAAIHAFEPSPEAYQKLVENTAGFPNVVTHPFALGRAEAVHGFAQSSASTMNHLLAPTAAPGEGTIKVQVRTGADTFRDLAAARIDYLKIDTEGHDYDVLLGMVPVLADVDFIEVEAAMNPYNKTHVPIRKVEDLLWHLGFHLFHIMEQTMEWKRGGRPVLRRSNPVFINGRFVDLRRID
jgi:FkbM family methyltransferase